MFKTPRVAVLGFHLESNRFAPPTMKKDFQTQCWEEGEGISKLARSLSHLPSEVAGFYERMDERGNWEPVPLIVIAAPPGGPADKDTWESFLVAVKKRLLQAGKVDAIYVANHGASAAEGVDDTETVLLQLLRSLVGNSTPILASHDLHCNVSQETIDLLDVLVSYRTNPHVDQRERGQEVADLLHEIFDGMKPEMAYIRLPITPPSVTLLTAAGPYADVIKAGEALMQAPEKGPIANVSACSGFVFSDLPKCGLTITVTARNDLDAARRTALKLARAAWADRGRYVANTINVEKAVKLAQSTQAHLLFADVADNPGGGGRGNTTWLLHAFDEAKIPNVVLGVFVDAELAADAAQLGEGATFTAHFNRAENSEYSLPYQAEATVLKLTDGNGVGRRGFMKDRRYSLGQTALIQLKKSGMLVVVGSLRRQLNEPRMLEMHGIDISKPKVVIVKSRGHYRAGFDEFFSDDRIFDVDSPGLTTPNLSQVNFKHLSRPVWPIDEKVEWIEPEWAKNLD